MSIVSQQARNKNGELILPWLSYFQGLPVKFLADPPLIPLAPKPESYKYVDFPCLFSTKFITFSWQIQVYSLPQNDLASLASKMLVFQTLVFAKNTGTEGYRRGFIQECRLPLFSPEALAVSLRKRICCLPLVNFQSPDNVGQFCPVWFFYREESPNSSCIHSWKFLSYGYFYAHLPHFTHEKTGT